MTENANEEVSGAEEGEGFDPRVILAGIMGGNSSSIHEGHVHGSVIEQTRSFMDEWMKPDLGEMTTPDGVSAPVIIDKSGVHVLPPCDFDEWRDSPRFRSGTAFLLDLVSFIEHAKRFSDEDSIIYADNNRAAPKVGAIFDYHRVGHDGDPRSMRHKSTFNFPLSDQWKEWIKYDGVQMNMKTFAAFLEDRITDVLPVEQFQPTVEQAQYVSLLGGMARVAEPYKLMEVSTGLQVHEESEVVSTVKLATGEMQAVFKSRHTDGQGGAISVPSMFAVAIPVFVNGDPYQVLARFRYRKNGPDLTLGYELWRTDRVFDHAFDEALDMIRTETGLPVLLGKAEA